MMKRGSASPIKAIQLQQQLESSLDQPEVPKASALSVRKIHDLWIPSAFKQTPIQSVLSPSLPDLARISTQRGL